MLLEEHKVEVDSLVIGMFVSRLDRPWNETPFPLQGFSVETLSDLDTLRRYCSYVYIDVRKSVNRRDRDVLQRLGYGVLPKSGTPRPPLTSYVAAAVPLAEELERARPVWQHVRNVSEQILTALRFGKRFSMDQLGAAIEPMVASVIRNSDAYFWLDTMRRQDPYIYGHAVNCSAMATTFGRQLGFPRSVLVDLASGGMLMDVGMAMLPTEVVHHANALTEAQRALMQRHVYAGLQRLEECGMRNLDVLDMIREHHERFDGSGYPEGAAGEGISLMGRVLGLVDTFDALCSDRTFQPRLSKHHALQLLYRERNKLFQAELLEQFSQCMGVYPTGSLVELSSGQIAVVQAQNQARRLYPRVTVLTDPAKNIDSAFPQLDLWQDLGPDGNRISVVRALAPGSFGIELAELYL